MSTSVGGSTIPVALSTASCYPESTASAFETAARLGYDGVEVMVWTDPISQDINAIRRLSDHHGVPILAVHAPCLLITQRVWGPDPWLKLQKAKKCAETVGARTVVVHPPFRWQREYAKDFISGVARMTEETDVVFAVENMFPLRGAGQTVVPYAPDWSPVDHDYGHVTLDLSHTSVSHSDPLQMADALGERLAHVHMADGIGSSKDEHLVPGRGTQPCAAMLARLRQDSYDGVVVVEINTRRCQNRAEREVDLAEALAFTRRHLSGDDSGAPSTWLGQTPLTA